MIEDRGAPKRDRWRDLDRATGLAGIIATVLLFLWFVVGLTTLLRRAEREPAWHSTAALVSGVLAAAHGVIDASWYHPDLFTWGRT